VEILLFFPRMTHKHPHLHLSETLIPKHIQNILWDRVILPSIRSVLQEMAAVYFPLDRAHSRFKQGLGNGNSARVPLHALQGDNMLEIAENMKGLVRQPFSFVWTRSDCLKIKEGSNSMDHFGSFFFLWCRSRGVKD
jgi:hypothetical protein